LTFPIEAGC